MCLEQLDHRDLRHRVSGRVKCLKELHTFVAVYEVETIKGDINPHLHQLVEQEHKTPQMIRQGCGAVVRRIAYQFEAYLIIILAVINHDLQVFHRHISNIDRTGRVTIKAQVIIKGIDVHHRAVEFGIVRKQPGIVPQVFGAIALVTQRFTHAARDLSEDINKAGFRIEPKAQGHLV